MQHNNYFEIQADSHFELGIKEGQLFGDNLAATISNFKKQAGWAARVAAAKTVLSYSEEVVPQLVLELKGYAQGAGIDFDDVWAMSLETDYSQFDKCTTVVTNNGKLIGHNEDWDAQSKDSICVLKKSVKNLTIFELFYFNTLGGNSISINSNGIVQSINSLSHSDSKRGVPRNLVARSISETWDPEAAFNNMKSWQRADGYNHNLVTKKGEVFSIESSAAEAILIQPSMPFVHTNHYLSKLQSLETNDNATGTFERYETARNLVKPEMNIEQMQQLLSDQSEGKTLSIFNERTIARMIVDLELMRVFVWLLRENDTGWVEYDLVSLIEDKVDNY